MPTPVEPYILSNVMLNPIPNLKLMPALNLIITDITDIPTDGADITAVDGEDITDTDGEDMDIGVKLWLWLVKCDLDNSMSSKLETFKTANISSFIMWRTLVFKIKIIINENKKNLSFQNKRHNAQLLIFLATAAANFF